MENNNPEVPKLINEFFTLAEPLVCPCSGEILPPGEVLRFIDTSTAPLPYNLNASPNNSITPNYKPFLPYLTIYKYADPTTIIPSALEILTTLNISISSIEAYYYEMESIPMAISNFSSTLQNSLFWLQSLQTNIKNRANPIGYATIVNAILDKIWSMTKDLTIQPDSSTINNSMLGYEEGEIANIAIDLVQGSSPNNEWTYYQLFANAFVSTTYTWSLPGSVPSDCTVTFDALGGLNTLVKGLQSIIPYLLRVPPNMQIENDTNYSIAGIFAAIESLSQNLTLGYPLIAAADNPLLAGEAGLCGGTNAYEKYQAVINSCSAIYGDIATLATLIASETILKSAGYDPTKIGVGIAALEIISGPNSP